MKVIEFTNFGHLQKVIRGTKLFWLDVMKLWASPIFNFFFTSLTIWYQAKIV